MEKRDTENDRPPSVYERTCAYIDRHFAEPVTLERAARAVGASTSSIVKAFRGQDEETFHGRLVRRRLEEARLLLSTQDIPLSLVAQETGFCNVSHLSRWFRRIHGMTPGRFRKLSAPKP